MQQTTKPMRTGHSQRTVHITDWNCMLHYSSNICAAGYYVSTPQLKSWKACYKMGCLSSSSSQVFLEWPKQQRHHEDHYESLNHFTLSFYVNHIQRKLLNNATWHLCKNNDNIKTSNSAITERLHCTVVTCCQNIRL